MSGGDNEACNAEYDEWNEAEFISSEAVEYASDKQLRYSVANEKKAQTKLYLYAAHAHWRGHGGQRGEVYVGSEAGKRE